MKAVAHLAAAFSLSFAAPALAGQSGPVEASHEALSGPLAGEYLEAGGEGAPLVLIIPGSGPTDRDGNNPLGVKAASYRLLAEALSEHGVASIRVDKRGMFASKAATANPNDVTLQDYAADMRAWISAARDLSGQPCVWLLGHSEGGLVALTTADISSDGICGLVLVASPGRPAGEVLMEQFRANPANAPILEQAERAIAALEAGEAVDEAQLHPGLRPLFGAHIRKFMVSFLAARPAEMLERFGGPALIVQPGEDIQVSMADAAALAQAQPNAVLVVVEEANHVLKTVAPGDRAANLATYANPDLPLADGLAEAIADFVKKGP